MNIEMTVGDLVKMYPAMDELSSIALPAKLAYRVSKMLRKMLPEMQAQEEARSNLIKKYGEESKEREDEWSVLPENIDAFKAEYESILEEEFVLERVAKISVEEMEGSGADFRPAMLADLYLIIEEEED